MTKPIVMFGGWKVRMGTPLESAMFRIDDGAKVDWEFRIVDSAPFSRESLRVLWASRMRLPGGEPIQRISADARCTRVVVEFSEVCTFFLTPRRTWVKVLDPDYHFMAEVRLLGYILALRHELCGAAAVHASALVTPSGAGVIVCGDKGAGKTLLALNALDLGWGMASDDIAPLSMDAGGRFRVRSTYPQVRLWGHDIARLGIDRRDVVQMAPAVDKKGVPLSLIGGRFHPQPAPLALAVMLSHVESGDDNAPGISMLHPSEAVFALAKNIFLRHLSVPLGWQRRHFEKFSRLASHVPVVRIPSAIVKRDTVGVIEQLQRLAERTERVVGGCA